MTRASAHRSASHAGFSLPELLVVTAVGALLIIALQQSILGQQRYHESQRAITARHETVRAAMATLGSALREASLARGDVTILGPGRVRVRRSLGLAFVCGTDNNGSRVGVVAMEGRWEVGAGDSVLVQRSGVWTADLIDDVDGPDKKVECTQGGGWVIRLDGKVPDIDIGSAAVAFRSQLLEIDTDGVSYGLYRSDGAQRDLLFGPLDGATGFHAWFEDAGGLELSGPSGAESISVRIVARNPVLLVRTSPRTDTLVMTFRGRNR